ncbi:uncharacterized protein I303_101647 [Kwoniella dejecticola CBS 10117]|uniref:Uncharacterized protein n=1 Tax=Kwoniella dejecticola CBS 10117 TaxID=1296121 RepID=A0A1A6AD64_9TREE|nr:uncharacterized protein I303_02217 [Kwoniella dejecticola CBS 10117]OBR88001.1 hypothetical protein I303_02217 [Kwoniella dejecticola CBS 10117]
MDPATTVAAHQSQPLPASQQTPSQPEYIYIIVETVHEYYNDRKGYSKVLSKFAYSTVFEANQAAQKLLDKKGGYRDYDEGRDSHIDCFWGRSRNITDKIDLYAIKVQEMKMVYPKIPKGKKRTSAGTAGQPIQQRGGVLRGSAR